MGSLCFLKDFEISMGWGRKRKTRFLLVNNKFFCYLRLKKTHLVKPRKLVVLVDDLGHLGHRVDALPPLWSKPLEIDETPKTRPTTLS